MTQLEEDLKTELLAVYDKASTIGYYPKYFKRMLTSSNPQYNKGPIGTVRHLMTGSAGPQSGFQRLRKAGKLEWTVEWLIATNPKWHPLFQNAEWVIKKAKARICDAEKGS